MTVQPRSPPHAGTSHSEYGQSPQFSSQPENSSMSHDGPSHHGTHQGVHHNDLARARGPSHWPPPIPSHSPSQPVHPPGYSSQAGTRSQPNQSLGQGQTPAPTIPVPAPPAPSATAPAPAAATATATTTGPSPDPLLKSSSYDMFRVSSTLSEPERIIAVKGNLHDIAAENLKAAEAKAAQARHVSAYQVWYPLFYLALTVASLLCGLVPPWRFMKEAPDYPYWRFWVIFPLMMTSAAISAVLFISSAVHTALVVFTGRTRVPNAAKYRSPAKMAWVLLASALTVAILGLFIACVVIMIANWKLFHQLLDRVSTVVWWCCIVNMAPILLWINGCRFYDIASMCQRRTEDEVVPLQQQSNTAAPAVIVTSLPLVPLASTTSAPVAS